MAFQQHLKANTTFRFSVYDEPARLRPHLRARLASDYILNNLFSGYFRINGNHVLAPALMKSCRWVSSTHLSCEPEKIHWANGQEIHLKDHCRHLQKILHKDELSTLKENFNDVKNYMSYLRGEVSFAKVGVRCRKKTLDFHLTRPNKDFLYALSHPGLSPYPSATVSDEVLAKEFSTGPFKLATWKRGRSFVFQANTFYRPQLKFNGQVEAFFVSEDSTALNMFETGQLDLVTRIPVEEVRRLKSQPGFSWVPFFRFDYIGFGPSLNSSIELRRALQHSFDPIEFQKVFLSKGLIGCASFPQHWMATSHCLGPDPTKAISAKTLALHKRLKLHYAKQGGETMARSLEWFQAQWKKNLNIRIELEPEDAKVLGAKLRQAPPSLFRRGVQLNAPSCLEALKVFTTNSADNFIKFSSKAYDRIVDEMGKPQTSESKQKSLCSKGVKLLLESALLIPLGEIHVPILHNQKFRGFHINGLNQLDLSELQPAD